MRRALVVAALLSIVSCRGCRRGPTTEAISDGGGTTEVYLGAHGSDAGAVPVQTRNVVRQPPRPPQANLAQIFLGYDHSSAPWNPPRGQKRTKAEAKALAERLAKEARAGADFTALATRESDWPLASHNGGTLGVVTQGEPGMTQLFDDSVFAMKVGEVADPYESPMGFHVVKKLPMLRLSHIYIAVRDGRDGWPARTKAEAKAAAAEIEAALKSGKAFGELAFERSDDLGTAGSGGDLGGQGERSPLNPAVKRVAQALTVGEVSTPIEVASGFEIVKRLE